MPKPIFTILKLDDQRILPNVGAVWRVGKSKIWLASSNLHAAMSFLDDLWLVTNKSSVKIGVGKYGYGLKGGNDVLGHTEVGQRHQKTSH